MRSASVGEEGGITTLEPNQIPPVTAFDQRIEARAKGRIVPGLAMGIDSRLVIIQFIQKEFVGVVRIGAHIEGAASGFFFERIAGLGLKNITHFFFLLRKSVEINYDSEHKSILLSKTL